MKWRKIVGFDNYEISDSFKVASIERRVGKSNKLIERRVLKTHINKQGVEYVKIMTNDGRQVSRTLIRLYADTFFDEGETRLYVPTLERKFVKEEDIKYLEKQGYDIEKYKRYGRRVDRKQ